MKFEIESAANFLSNLLKLHSSILSPDQLERFRESIERCLEGHYENHWFPDRPTKGSGYRCIRINHKMDPLLAKAGKSCGLDNQALKTIFPNELTLWIDPREVSYRIGENGSICVLFDGNTSSNGGSGGSSDSDSGSTSSSGSSSISSSPPNGSVDTNKSTTMGSSFHMSSMATSPSTSNHHHIGSHHMMSNSFMVGTPNRSKHVQSMDHSSQYPVSNNVMRRSPSHNLNRTTFNSHYNGHQSQQHSSHHQVQHSMNGYHSQSMRTSGHGMNHSLNGHHSSSTSHTAAGRGSPTDSSSTSTMSSPSPSSSPDWCKMGSGMGSGMVYDRRSSPEHWNHHQRSPMSGQHNMNSNGHHGNDTHHPQQQSMSNSGQRQHSSPVSVMSHGMDSHHSQSSHSAHHSQSSHSAHHSQSSHSGMGMYAPYGPHQQTGGSGFPYNSGVMNGHQRHQYSSFPNRNFATPVGPFAAANTWAGSPF